MTPVLADSSFLVALLNKRERPHLRCLKAYQLVTQPVITCEACITEAFHLLNHLESAVDNILGSLADGSIVIPFRLSDNADAVYRTMTRYRDTRCDFADACLIHLADLVGTGEILTLDSDFKLYRWRRSRRFRLLIPLE